VFEATAGVAVGIRQRRPQLHTVQHGRRAALDCGRHLRVTDSGARCHQIELTRTHDCVDARAIAVLYLAAEQPADGLQSGVGMRGDVHPGGTPNVVWAVVVGKAPSADQRPLSLRKCAPDLDRPRAAQRDFPWPQHLQRLEL
jgi:hypothetical protein